MHFLGIKMSFISDSKVCIDMREYLQKIVDLFGEGNLKPLIIPTRSKIRLHISIFSIFLLFLLYLKVLYRKK